MVVMNKYGNVLFGYEIHACVQQTRTIYQPVSDQEQHDSVSTPDCWQTNLHTAHSYILPLTHSVELSKDLSHSTQYGSFRRRYFYRSDDPTNSVKALKEDNNKHKNTMNTHTYKKTQKIRSLSFPSLPPAHTHGTSSRSAYVTLVYRWLFSTNIWKRTYSTSRFETTAHLWHLWFICAIYFTYWLS